MYLVLYLVSQKLATWLVETQEYKIIFMCISTFVATVTVHNLQRFLLRPLTSVLNTFL